MKWIPLSLCAVCLFGCVLGTLLPPLHATEPEGTPDTRSTTTTADAEVDADAETGVGDGADAEAVSPLSRNPDIQMDNLFQMGERLVYVAKWSGIPGGFITSRAWPVKRQYRQQEVYLFEMQIETNDFISAFYPIQSTIRSFVDAETGHSLLFSRNVREGTYRAHDRTRFEYTHQNELGVPSPVALTTMVREQESEARPPRPIPGPLADPLSIAYYMRHLEVTHPGDSADVLVSDRDRVSRVTVTLLRFEQIHLRGIGTFDCLVIQPSAREHGGLNDGLLKTEGAVTVWVERNTKIPLFGEVDIPIGRATAVLVDFENCNLEAYIVKKAEAGESKEDATLPETVTKEMEEVARKAKEALAEDGEKESE